MYTRQQASQLRHEFWTTFGQYMAPVLSADGLKVNWVNYKTGEKNIHFRMQADNRSASIAIELTHGDADVQQLYFEQWLQLKNILHSFLIEEWQWQLHTFDDHGKQISRIYTEITGINIFNKQDWPTLISFFKPRIMALDEFWSMARPTFEALH